MTSQLTESPLVIDKNRSHSNGSPELKNCCFSLHCKPKEAALTERNNKVHTFVLRAISVNISLTANSAFS